MRQYKANKIDLIPLTGSVYSLDLKFTVVCYLTITNNFYF
jgi:hypothetical protein